MDLRATSNIGPECMCMTVGRIPPWTELLLAPCEMIHFNRPLPPPARLPIA